MFTDGQAIRGEAGLLAAAIGALDVTEVEDRVVELLHGDAADRRRALMLVDRAEVAGRTGILIGLAADPDSAVRADAVAMLAARFDRGEGLALVEQALRSAVRDPGTRVPEAVAGTLREADTAIGRELHDSLRTHRSARVRRAAHGT